MCSSEWGENQLLKKYSLISSTQKLGKSHSNDLAKVWLNTDNFYVRPSTRTLSLTWFQYKNWLGKQTKLRLFMLVNKRKYIVIKIIPKLLNVFQCPFFGGGGREPIYIPSAFW